MTGKQDLQQAPPGWGEDPLSEFLDIAANNTHATFANHHNAFKRLEAIDGAFRNAAECLINDPKVVPGLFLLRSHACFLGGARLALAAETFECFPVLRACLESALYGLFIARNPEQWEVWANRDQSEEARRKMKGTFTVGRMLRCLKEVDEKLYDAIQLLYDRTIDFGGHPNPLGLFGSLEINTDDTHVKFEAQYMTDDSTRITHALKSTAQAGLGALGVFKNAYPERFEISRLSDRITRLSVGL